MAGMTTTDPWGDDDKVTKATSVTIIEQPVTVTTTEVIVTEYSCPHCGTTLTPHNDAVGSLHCHGPSCVDCCFLPPEAGNTEPRTKMEARPCPMAQRVGSF